MTVEPLILVRQCTFWYPQKPQAIVFLRFFMAKVRISLFSGRFPPPKLDNAEISIYATYICLSNFYLSIYLLIYLSIYLSISIYLADLLSTSCKSCKTLFDRKINFNGGGLISGKIWSDKLLTLFNLKSLKWELWKSLSYQIKFEHGFVLSQKLIWGYCRPLFSKFVIKRDFFMVSLHMHIFFLPTILIFNKFCQNDNLVVFGQIVLKICTQFIWPTWTKFGQILHILALFM